MVVLVAGLLIRNAIRSSEAAGYKSYIETVTTIVAESDKVGAGLTSLLLKPGNATRKDVQTKLDQYIQTSEELNQQAKDLKAPSSLKEAHQWFTATMQLRARGLANLKPSLMNALEVQDIEVSSDQVTRAMQLLMLSDVAYQEFFVERATAVLIEKKISDVTVPTTSFLTDTTLASKTKVKEVLTTLKSSGGLQAVHGVTLIKVVASPANVEIKQDGTYNLISNEKLSFKITVENSGNMTEKDVPVTFRLQAPSSAQPQLKTEKIAEIKAEAKVDDRHHRDQSHPLRRDRAHPRPSRPRAQREDRRQQRSRSTRDLHPLEPPAPHRDRHRHRPDPRRRRPRSRSRLASAGDPCCSASPEGCSATSA